MKKYSLFILLFTTILLRAGNDFSKNIPPYQPVLVKISLYTIDIGRINSKEQSFDIDVVVRYEWKDKRLAGKSGQYPLSAIWNPNIQIFNLLDEDTRMPKIVEVDNNGTVVYNQRYYATLKGDFDFKRFPYDEQYLPIVFGVFGYSPNQVKLVFNKAGNEKKFSVSDWQVEPVGYNIFEKEVFTIGDEKPIVRSMLVYKFKAKRYIHFYFWKVLAPMLVILFLSWAVFWIDPSQVGAQIGVSGTSILSLIAFLYRLDKILPPVAYLTKMDSFIYTSLILVFGAYLEALTSTTFALKGKKEFALKLDFTFRIVYPFLFLIVYLVFWRG